MSETKKTKAVNPVLVALIVTAAFVVLACCGAPFNERLQPAGRPTAPSAEKIAPVAPPPPTGPLWVIHEQHDPMTDEIVRWASIESPDQSRWRKHPAITIRCHGELTIHVEKIGVMDRRTAAITYRADDREAVTTRVVQAGELDTHAVPPSGHAQFLRELGTAEIFRVQYTAYGENQRDIRFLMPPDFGPVAEMVEGCR